MFSYLQINTLFVAYRLILIIIAIVILYINVSEYPVKPNNNLSRF
jgi:hypothetical protein